MRSLVRRPTFSAVALVTLALGAGITTAAFAVADAVLVRSLPYPDAGQLVTVFETNPTQNAETSLIAPARLVDWNRLNHTFTGIAGLYTENVTDTSGREPERLNGRRVTPHYFEVFGMPPLAGRTFSDEEQRAGAAGTAVISESFWTRRFARDPAALGQSLIVGGAGVRIIGVMPLTFNNAGVDLWLPAQISDFLLQQREARFLSGFGRIKIGVSMDQARDDLASVQRALGAQFPATDKDWSVRCQNLREAMVGGRERPIWLVFTGVGLLWLIGVTNLAGLMLVEMRRRGRELAVRAAIGASRGQVVATVMREAFVLAAAGGALGAGLAVWLVSVARASFTQLPRATEIGVSGRALLFTLATSVAATIVFGLWPALHGTRGSLVNRVSQGGTRGTSARHHRLQHVLVTAQVGLSVLLVGSALLLARTYFNLAGADSGFSSDDVVKFHVGALWSEDRSRIGQIQEQLVSALERTPGVEAAGFTNFLPLSGATLRYQISITGIAGPDRDGTMTAGERTVTPGYLRALRIPLVAGEHCRDVRMDFNAPREAMLNRRFADTFLAGQNAIGRELHFSQDRQGSPIRIVGIVGDVAEDGPGLPPVPYIYICMSAGSWPDPEYVVRSRDPRAVMASVRQIVHGLDASRAIFAVRPLGEVVRGTLDEPRLSAAMIGLFAASALGLASLGLYSLFMLLVAEGTREFGVRLALGAAPGQVVGLIVASAGRLCLAGLGVGLLLAVGAGRLLSALLYGVRPIDPLSLVVTAATLGLAAVAAVALPAIRAARIEPVIAMRAD